MTDSSSVLGDRPAIQGMGVHVLANFFACPEPLLTRKETIAELLAEVVREAELRPLKQEFHQFEPAGVTGFVLLAESHLSIHTWPEHRSMAVDIFCCFLGPGGKQQALDKADRAFQALTERFAPEKVSKQVVMR